jgi:hypothetical protein
MSQLTRLSQALIDEPLAPRPNVDELWTRSRRRHQRRRSITAGLLALVIIGAFSIVKIEDSSPSSNSPKNIAASVQLASYYRAAGAVSNSTLNAVGLPSNVAVPTLVTPSISTVATNGVVSYVGAEYCPYCAIQRWALLVALSKFGSFTNLDNQVFSSSSDAYPGLASWSFIGAKYTSTYFAFDPTELSSSIPSTSGGYQPLEKMSAAQQRAFDKYNPQAGLPFVDFGNHFITLGASASPSVLEGLTLGDIGGDLSNATSPVAQAIDGTANYLIAALCTMVQDKTPPICSTLVTHVASKALDSGVSPTSKSSSTSVAPTQPPTNAPLSVWKAWSAEEHASMLYAAATYRPSNPACTVQKISVVGTRYKKTTLGIPPGVTVWGLSFSGVCPPGDAGRGLGPRSP